MRQKHNQVSAGERFRAAVAEEKPLQVAGAINAYTARMAEATGFRALYLSGGGVAANSLGIPDLGISTMEDVLIDVRAAGLNPLDYKIRSGKAKLALPLRPPIGLGCDVAGVVSAIGAKVTRFAVGAAVYARLEKLRMAGLAERVAADENIVSRKPDRASVSHAPATLASS